MYGEGFASHLSLLARESDATRELVSSALLRPFWNKVKDGKVATHVLIGEEEQNQVRVHEGAL
jgi:hypothetical protein